MEKRIIIEDKLTAVRGRLQEEAREKSIIEKCLRDIRAFAGWAGGREVNKELTASWKEHLKGEGFRPETINGKLCRKLQKYAKKQKIVSGEIFLTRNGKGLTRRQIWAEMKALCNAACVAPSKVFPHNLRHLFARTFYKIYKDMVKLADVLGHSSVETTRIYRMSTGIEHARQIERLGLIS